MHLLAVRHFGRELVLGRVARLVVDDVAGLGNGWLGAGQGLYLDAAAAVALLPNPTASWRLSSCTRRCLPSYTEPRIASNARRALCGSGNRTVPYPAGLRVAWSRAIVHHTALRSETPAACEAHYQQRAPGTQPMRMVH